MSKKQAEVVGNKQSNTFKKKIYSIFILEKQAIEEKNVQFSKKQSGKMAEWLLRQFGRLVPLWIVGSIPTFSEKKRIEIERNSF